MGSRWGTNNRDERCDAGKREVLSKGRGPPGVGTWAPRISQAARGETSQISTLGPSQAAGSSKLVALSDLQGPHQKMSKAERANFVIGRPLAN